MGKGRGSASGGWADPLPPTWVTTGYGEQADGTHPTGMHSCLSLNSMDPFGQNSTSECLPISLSTSLPTAFSVNLPQPDYLDSCTTIV